MKILLITLVSLFSVNSFASDIVCEDNSLNNHYITITQTKKNGIFEFSKQENGKNYKYVVNLKHNKEENNYLIISNDKYKMTYSLKCVI